MRGIRNRGGGGLGGLNGGSVSGDGLQYGFNIRLLVSLTCGKESVRDGREGENKQRAAGIGTQTKPVAN